jgi:TPR repeat protein
LSGSERADWKAAPERHKLVGALKLMDRDRPGAILRLKELAEGRSETAAKLAMYNLGILYESNPAGHPDHALAEAWFRRAGDAGLREAEFSLAKMFRREGRFDKALETLRYSAAVGYSPSMRLLGRMHHDGQGTSRDLAEARRWMERASERGNVFAARLLAVWMLKGELGILRIPLGLLIYLKSILDALVILFISSENDVRVN